MKYSQQLLEKIGAITLPSKEILDELITDHLAEVESIETITSEDYSTDHTIDIEITPNRYGDLLSHVGFLRELCIFTKQPFSNIYAEIPTGFTVIKQKGDSIKTGSKRIVFVRIPEVKNTQSPAWIKNILASCDMTSKSLLVDITNLVMIISGQPVHVYDASKCSGTFLVDVVEEGEIFTMMGGKEYILSEGDMVIRDSLNQKILSLAGIKGGDHAIVDEHTTDAIFELGVFDENNIRKTSRRLKLVTDASKRFSIHRNGVLIDDALHALYVLLAELAHIDTVYIDDTNADTYTAPIITVSESEIMSLLGYGSALDPLEIIKILELIGCAVVYEHTDFKVTVPAYRVDLNYAVDVIEEIGRIHGYSNIPEELPRLLFTPHKDKKTLITSILRTALSESGFNEVRNHSLVSSGSLTLSSPVSKERVSLRDTLLPAFKQSVESSRLNKDFLEIQNVCMYEIGTVFKADALEELLLVIFDGSKKMKQFEMFIDMMNEKKCMNMLDLITEESGYKMYRILPENIDEEDYSYEFIGDTSENKKFVMWGLTPYSTRDVSCFIPEDVSVQEVLNLCKEIPLKNLIKTPYIADEYTKDDKTSVLIRFVFQGENSNLTDDEVNIEIEKIYTLLKQKGCEMR